MTAIKKQEKEILADFDVQFKDVRNRLNDQLKSLDSRQESQQKLLEDFQEYCKQRAEVEVEYGKRLEKIYDSFTRRQSTHRVQRDWAGEAGVPSPIQCWNMLLDNTRSQSKQHQTLSQMYSVNFANNLACIREGLENVHRKSREMTIGVHEDLIRQLNELYSAIKSYHNAHRDCKEAEQKKKQTEAEIQRLEDKNKRIDKRLDKQLEKNTGKFHEAELKATKARNDYITILGAVNSSLQKYFERDVTNIIDCLDLGYIRLLRRNLKAQQAAENEVKKMRGDELQRLELCIRNMSANADKKLFMDANQNAFTMPDAFDFHPHPGDQTHEMTAPHSFIGDMEQTFERLNKKTADLQLEVDEVQKSMRAVNRGWDDDESNPTEEEVVNHFKTLRQIVSSPSVSGGLNRVPSVRRAGKNLQQDTELYYLNKYKEYLQRSKDLARTKSKRDLLKTALGYDRVEEEEYLQQQDTYSVEHDKSGADHHSRRFVQHNAKTLSRRPVSRVDAKLFGGDLIAYVKASRRDIPLVVERCVEYITLYGLNHQGIFRMPGSTQDVSEMQEAFEKGRDVLYELGPKGDINLVASLLKLYFRKLPEPIFPSSMFEEFIDCTRTKQGHDRIPDLAQLIERLEKPLMIVMRYLFQFLKTLSQNSDETYMDSRNLATCLGPTLMWGPDDLDPFQYAGNVNEVIESMILFQEDIFPKAEGDETTYNFISISEGKDGLDDIDEEKSDISAIANSDYVGQTPEELSFKKDDKLTLHKQIEGNSWEASLGEQKGVVRDSLVTYESTGVHVDSEMPEPSDLDSSSLLHPSLQDRKNSANKLALELNSIIKSTQLASPSGDQNGVEDPSKTTPSQQLPDVLQNSPVNSRPGSVVTPLLNVTVTPPSEESPTLARKGPPPPVRPRSVRRARARPGPPSTGSGKGGTL